MDLIKPEDVDYIFNNPDGKTATVGIRVKKIVDVPHRVSGKPIPTESIMIEKRETTVNEANTLAAAVAKIRSQIDKYERENGKLKQTKEEGRRFNGADQRK